MTPVAVFLQSSSMSLLSRWHTPQPQQPSQPPEAVDHPTHYNSHPKGIECIDVIEEWPFNIATAAKYLWRCDHKGKDVEDLRKAVWYLEREIARRLLSGYGNSDSTPPAVCG